MDKFAVIVAGGSGSRMKSSIPKQFLQLCGKPILMHTLLVFYEYDPDIKIILVLPRADEAYWKELVDQHEFTVPHKIIHGGASRFQSVKNGLSNINTTGVVAIHDGVRPFVDADTLEKLYTTAQARGNATTCVPMKESLRYVNPANSKNNSVSRNDYVVVQTPQVFQVGLLQEAFRTEEQTWFTDDTSVFEHAGHHIVLVEGSYRNIKITTPEDMVIGEALLQSK